MLLKLTFSGKSVKVKIEDNAAFNDLLKNISSSFNIPYFAIEILIGFPPAVLNIDIYGTVASSGIQNGSTLTVRMNSEKGTMLERLVNVMGFPDAIGRQAVELAGGDMKIAVDICNQLVNPQQPQAHQSAGISTTSTSSSVPSPSPSTSPPSLQVSSPTATLARPPPAPVSPRPLPINRWVTGKVSRISIPADNSCLFNSIACLLNDESSDIRCFPVESRAYRQIIADTVMCRLETGTSPHQGYDKTISESKTTDAPDAASLRKGYAAGTTDGEKKITEEGKGREDGEKVKEKELEEEYFVVYTEDILGRPPSEYASWILNTDHWGGEIEMSILSNYLKVEIAAIEIATGRLYLYGENRAFNSRIYLLYDGTHYDGIAYAYSSDNDISSSGGGAVGKNDKTGLSHSGSSGGGRRMQKRFSPADEFIVDEVRALAAQFREEKRFTNLAGCTLQCKLCGKGFIGQKEAVEHAQISGHQNFGQVE